MAGDAPGDAPTQTPSPAAAAPMPAPADSVPLMANTAASVDAREPMPEPSVPTPTGTSPELLPELSPSAPSPQTPADVAEAATPELSPVAGLETAPEPSPAVNLVNAPELSLAACGARLAELFPALFLAPGAPGPAKPIKLRIHADIQARAPGLFTKRALGIFFSRYTTTNAYLKALANAPHRFDLDGQPAGEIAAEHSQAATEELARRHALAAERRAAQRPPRPEVRPAAEGRSNAGAERDARPDRRSGPRPGAGRDVRPDRRQDGPAAARPPHRPAGGAQRFERSDERARDGSPSPQSARPPRPPRPPHHADRAPQGPRPQRPERAPQMQRPEPPAALPFDPAQRERAMLLRSFESSPLSKANFCALKGMTPAALDAALAQAQAERDAPPGTASHRGGSGG
jgi:ProP effector